MEIWKTHRTFWKKATFSIIGDILLSLHLSLILFSFCKSKQSLESAASFYEFPDLLTYQIVLIKNPQQFNIFKQKDYMPADSNLFNELAHPTDYGHTMKPFLIKIPNFWAWADNWCRSTLGNLGYFRPIYQHPYWYCESLVHVFH